MNVIKDVPYDITRDAEARHICPLYNCNYKTTNSGTCAKIKCIDLIKKSIICFTF